MIIFLFLWILFNFYEFVFLKFLSLSAIIFPLMLIFQNQHVPQLLYLKFLKVKLFVSTKYWDNQYYSDQFYNLQQLNFFSLQVLVLPLKIFSINLQGFFWVIFIATLLIFIVFSFIFIFFTFLSFQLQLPLVFFILVKLTLLYRNQNLFIKEFLQIFLQILPLPKLENQSIIINLFQKKFTIVIIIWFY